MPRKTILIVEDESLTALGLALAVEEAGAVVIGPVSTVCDALALLDAGGIDAAVVDANLLDGYVTPLAIRLAERALPFVIHTAAGLPGALADAFIDVPLVMKPASPDMVVGTLLAKLR